MTCASTRSAKGLLLGITVFWGWPKHPKDWAYHPFNTQNGGPTTDSGKEASQVQRIHSPGTEVWQEPWSEAWPTPKKNQWLWERFAKKLIDETAAFGNVFFVFMDEHSYSGGNGGDHFLRFFKDRGALWVDWERRRAAVDVVFGAVRFREDTGKNHGAVEAFLRTPARPFLSLEGGPYQGDAVRVSVWSFLMGGGHYLLHDDEGQETVHTGIMAYDPRVPGGDTGQVRRAWLGHAARFFNEAVQNLDAMTPNNALTGGGAWCLAAPGKEYAVYSGLSAEPTFSLDLAGVSGTFRSRFYDPRTGQWRDAGQRAGGAVHSFAKPSETDWALHAVAAEN